MNAGETIRTVLKFLHDRVRIMRLAWRATGRAPHDASINDIVEVIRKHVDRRLHLISRSPARPPSPRPEQTSASELP